MTDVTVPKGMKIHGINGKEYRGGDVVPVANLREEQVVKLEEKSGKKKPSKIGVDK